MRALTTRNGYLKGLRNELMIFTLGLASMQDDFENAVILRGTSRSFRMVWGYCVSLNRV